MQSASRMAMRAFFDSTVMNWTERVEKEQYDMLMKSKGSEKPVKWKGWDALVEDGKVIPKSTKDGWMITEQYLVSFKKA